MSHDPTDVDDLDRNIAIALYSTFGERRGFLYLRRYRRERSKVKVDPFLAFVEETLYGQARTPTQD